MIGAAIADADQRKVLVRTISPDEFLVPQHPAIWRALRVVVDRGLEYSPALMRRLVAEEGGVVEDSFLDDLERGAEVPQNLGWHVETMRFDATRARALQGPVPELVRKLREPKSSPDDVRAAARSVLRSLEAGGRRFIHRPDELYKAYTAELTARRAVGNFFSMGWEPLDAMLSEGSMPQKTCIVGGLPGSGKTTWMCQLIVELAKRGRRPFYCAFESGAVSALDVMTSSMTRVPLAKIVSGGLEQEEIGRVNKAVRWLCDRVKFMENPFHDRDTVKGRPSNERNLDILEGYIAESACDVVVMDLWQRALVDHSPEGVTNALMRQQRMHETYNVFGILVHQLNLKEIEQRQNKRPTRDVFKGTSAFIEVADLLFGVHRDALHKSVPDDKFEVICMKQRKGKFNWCVQFDWDAERCLITGGREVPYNPGLDASPQFGSGDIGSQIKTGFRRPKPKAPSREPEE